MSDEIYPASYNPVFYAKKPESLYEKYVEAWAYFSKGLRKKQIQEFANGDWKTATNEAKHELIRKHIRAIRKRKNSLFSFGFTKMTKTSKSTTADLDCDTATVSKNNNTDGNNDVVMIDENNDVSMIDETENASCASTDNKAFLCRRSVIDHFLRSLGDEQSNLTELLADPSVEQSKILLDSMLEIAPVYNDVYTKLQSYERGKTKCRESKLSKTLSEFYSKRNELKLQIMEAINIKIDPALGLQILKANAERKENIIKDLAINLLLFKTFIKESGINYSLQRRLVQISKSEKNDVQLNPEKATMLCFNNSKLTWDDAFHNLTRDTNTYDIDVYNMGVLIRDSAVVRVKEDISSVKESIKETKSFIKSLLVAYPLMFLKNINGDEFLINLHQTSNGGDEISSLLWGDSHTDTDTPSCSPTSSPPGTPRPLDTPGFSRSQSALKTKSNMGGRKSIVERFPTIPDVATEFIQRNGYKAQEKRRNDDFVSCGVSVEDVRHYLLKTIPGLSEHGLCKSTVRYLFKPVHKSRNTSKLYKGLVDCRVPQKDNSGRPSDENSHYLHSRVNMRLEQAFYFDDEHIAFSADAMNKINVGNILCVSRYHQIRRVFMVEDKVKVNDHDFPQGYKIIPCGKMPLLKTGVFLNDIFGDAVKSQTECGEDIYEHYNIEEETGYDTDGCINDDSPDSHDRGKEPQIETDNLVEYKNDKLRRPHVKFPRTGPVIVYNRNGQFHSQTMEAHANDFLPLLKNAVNGGRSCIVCVVDNGPDMNPTNYVNEYHLGNLWLDAGADMLIITSYAAGQSAYNMIEHAWSPLSNRLTSVKLSANLPGEDKPPNKQSDLTPAERETKEKVMLDNAADMLAKYWDCCSFDGHPVVPITVPSDEEKVYDNHKKILEFVGAPLRVLKCDKEMAKLRKKFIFFSKHSIRRHTNEFILMKCQFFKQSGLECDYCRENPPTASKTLQFMKKHQGKFMQPTKSESHPGHFLTFLEMIKLDEYPEEEVRGVLGKCVICPNCFFSSVTEQDRHRKLFHPNSKIMDVVPESSQIHTCTFKINDKVCGETFTSHHLLWKHKSIVGHKKDRLEKAKKQAQDDEERSKKKKAEKTIVKKVANQKIITNCFVPSQEETEISNSEVEAPVDEEEEVVVITNCFVPSQEETEISNSEVEAPVDEEEEVVVDVDDDDCNARPCKIDMIIKKSNQTVEWVQCRLCPKWYHQYCVEIDDTSAALFECNSH